MKYFAFAAAAFAALTLAQDDAKKIAEDVAALKKEVAALNLKVDGLLKDLDEIKRVVSRRKPEKPAHAGPVAVLMRIVVAEENLKGNDVDRNGIGDYWTGDVAGLHYIIMTATVKPTSCLANLDAVAADAYTYADAGGTFDGIDMDADGAPDTQYSLPAGLKRAPSGGYWFQAMVNDEQGNAYAADTDGAGNCHNYGQYAFAAVPAEYGEKTRYCYIVNNIGTVFRRDFGKDTIKPKPGTQITEFAPGEPLNWPDATTLGSKWGKAERDEPVGGPVKPIAEPLPPPAPVPPPAPMPAPVPDKP